LELIKVNQTEQGMTIDGRELHEFLEVGRDFSTWIKDKIEKYGFIEGMDFSPKSGKTSDGGRPRIDYELSIDMAKELCMVENNEKGRQARKYFIECERRLKQITIPRTLPEALRLAADLAEKNEALLLQNAQKEQIINELRPKATYYDLVLQNKSLLSISKIAKDYGMSAIAMNSLLHELGVQFKQGDCWLLYQKYADKGYTQSKTHVIDGDRSKLNTYWTQKGRLFIYDLLKTRGILPLIEQDKLA